MEKLMPTLEHVSLLPWGPISVWSEIFVCLSRTSRPSSHWLAQNSLLQPGQGLFDLSFIWVEVPKTLKEVHRLHTSNRTGWLLPLPLSCWQELSCWSNIKKSQKSPLHISIPQTHSEWINDWVYQQKRLFKEFSFSSTKLEAISYFPLDPRT